ncbi:hypothetical protein GCM10028821_22180 [Hymenobacter jeollabukensis]
MLVGLGQAAELAQQGGHVATQREVVGRKSQRVEQRLQVGRIRYGGHYTRNGFDLQATAFAGQRGKRKRMLLNRKKINFSA